MRPPLTLELGQESHASSNTTIPGYRQVTREELQRAPRQAFGVMNVSDSFLDMEETKTKTDE